MVIMTKNKLNCMEYWRCGQEPEGCSVNQHRECSVATTENYNRINDGKVAVRYCWTISGILGNKTVKNA